MYFHKAQEKPRLYGSFQDRQYSIWRNLEDIYGCNHESEVLIMPGFWGFPLLDYSKFGNDGTNYGATYKERGLDLDGTTAYMEVPILNLNSNTVTISVQIKRDGVQNDWAGIVVCRGGYTAAGLNIGTDEELRYVWNGVEWNWNSGLILPDNELSFVSLVLEPTKATIFLNNSFAINTTNHAAEEFDTITKIGFDSAFAVRKFDGLIYEVRIAKATRSNDTIALFHDRPWDLYWRVARPIWSIPSGITLTVAAIDGAGLLDSVNLTQKHNLTVQALLGAGLLDNVSLAQKHLLVLQELLSSGVLDNVILIQKHLLSVQELSGAGALDNVSLTQKHLLAVQELLSYGTLDNIDLITAILLVVSDLISSGTLDNIELTQKHMLAVQKLLSSGLLDNITLTQKHLLAVQSLLSAGTLDAIELILATLLVVSDLLSAGVLDSAELTQKHVLTVQEVLSAGVLDSVALTQKQLLIINNLLSSGLIDTINFDIVSGLIYISLSQATEYNISLSQATEYNILLSETGGGV